MYTLILGSIHIVHTYSRPFNSFHSNPSQPLLNAHPHHWSHFQRTDRSIERHLRSHDNGRRVCTRSRGRAASHFVLRLRNGYKSGGPAPDPSSFKVSLQPLNTHIQPRGWCLFCVFIWNSFCKKVTFFSTDFSDKVCSN